MSKTYAEFSGLSRTLYRVKMRPQKSSKNPKSCLHTAGVTCSIHVSPTIFSKEIKHLGVTLGAFFLMVSKKCPKAVLAFWLVAQGQQTFSLHPGFLISYISSTFAASSRSRVPASSSIISARSHSSGSVVRSEGSLSVRGVKRGRPAPGRAPPLLPFDSSHLKIS